MITIDSPHTLGKLRQINTWRRLSMARLDGLRKAMLRLDEETDAGLEEAVNSLCDAFEEAAAREWERRKGAARGDRPAVRAARPDPRRILDSIARVRRIIVAPAPPFPAPNVASGQAGGAVDDDTPIRPQTNVPTPSAAASPNLPRPPRRLFDGPGRPEASFAEIARTRRSRNGPPPGPTPCSPWLQLWSLARGKRPFDNLCPLAASASDGNSRDRPAGIDPAAHPRCATRCKAIRAA